MKISTFKFEHFGRNVFPTYFDGFEIKQIKTKKKTHFRDFGILHGGARENKIHFHNKRNKKNKNNNNKKRGKTKNNSNEPCLQVT